jgi:SAM-dependent methyltransferase
LVHRRELRILRGLLAGLEIPMPTCLDAPCGFGRLVALLREVLSPSLVVGADWSRERLEALPGLPGGRVQPVSLDLQKPLPFADEAFDLVFSIRFLQHVQHAGQRRQVLRELLRVARCFLIVSYYDSGGFHGLLRGLQRKLGSRRGAPLATLSPAVFAQEVAAFGGVVLVDRATAPWFHAQHLALVEKAAAGVPGRIEP